MVRLVPMMEGELEAYLEKSIPEYAAENVRAGYWTQAEALERSQKIYQNLLPQGVKTEHNYLFRIQVEESGEKIGILWMKHEAPHPHGFIFEIKLDEPMRGKGYGKQAMLAIEEVAKGLGIQTIGLHVFAHNLAAMQLYKNLGSLGISVVDSRIWGCARAYARAHPQIRPLSRQILKNQNLGYEVTSQNMVKRLED